jgi:hypothetical protein
MGMTENEAAAFKKAKGAKTPPGQVLSFHPSAARAAPADHHLSMRMLVLARVVGLNAQASFI